MPILNKIVIRDFRNIVLQELEFSPNVNCISGGNGEGKTNLLDAIWYLSMTKSAFSLSDRFNFRHGCGEFALSGVYDLPDGSNTRISVRVADGADKKLNRDGKPYTRISDHVGLIPIVMVSPADTSMVSESGEERRKFVNSVLSQMSGAYLNDVQQYNRLLLQRNRLLKDGNPDESLLDVLDERMSALAEPISKRRQELSDGLNPIVQRYYDGISGGAGEVAVQYVTDLSRGRLKDLLSASRHRDSLLKYTTAGIQRDDFIFALDGYPIRRFGSQGQQKSFLVALKFAQYELMKEACGFAPILLLDDLFDKLDLGRVSNLLSMVAGTEFGQIFITDSNKVRIRSLVDGVTAARTYYEAEGGVFTCSE